LHVLSCSSDGDAAGSFLSDFAIIDFRVNVAVPPTALIEVLKKRGESKAIGIEKPYPLLCRYTDSNGTTSGWYNRRTGKNHNIHGNPMLNSKMLYLGLLGLCTALLAACEKEDVETPPREVVAG
jgi:hypothetical protein